MRRAYPGIDIEIVAANRPGDLRKCGADIAAPESRLRVVFDLLAEEPGQAPGRPAPHHRN